MDYAAVQQKTREHLGAALRPAFEFPVVCITHAPREDGRLGVTGRIFAELALYGVAEVTLLDTVTVAHSRGYVVTEEPKLFQEAIALALSDFGDVLAQAVEEGRVVLCGWFAQAIWRRTEGLAAYLDTGLVSTVPHPDRWIQDPEPIHAVLTQALNASGYQMPADFPPLAAFSRLLSESKAAQMREWWETMGEAERETLLGKRRLAWENMTDAQYMSLCERQRQVWAAKSPEEMAEIGATRSKFWKELPPERWEAIKEKKRELWREKSVEEREEHGRKSRERWAALSAEEKQARGAAISAGLSGRTAEAKALTSAKKRDFHASRSSEAKQQTVAKRLQTREKWSDEKKAKVSKKHSDTAKTLNLSANCQLWRENASPEELAAAAGKAALSQINTKALKAEETAKETRRALDEGTVLSRDKVNWILRAYRKRELQRAAGNLTVPTPVADELARELQPDSSRSRTKQRTGAARSAAVAEKDAPALLAALESITKTQAQRLIAGHETRNRQRAQGWDIPATPLSDKLVTALQLRSDMMPAS